jgi:pimeloyl-ACP methyl ester carboxylesterase
MDTSYNYPYKKLWDEKAWEPRMSEVLPLARWIERKNIEINRIPARPENERPAGGIYDRKARALTDPNVVEYWRKKGLHYHCTSMNLSWIAMIPTEHLPRRDYDDDMDTILVLVNASQSDPSWCMYVLEKYKAILEHGAENKIAFIFVVSDSFDETDQYISILQEAVILFHINYNRIFLDISTVYQAGIKLNEIEGFHFTDAGGGRSNADNIVSVIGGVSLLNISGKWTNKDSLICKSVNGESAGNSAYDRQALINSATGRKLAQAMHVEFEYDDVRDTALLSRWNDMGLVCAFHEKEGEQWITFTPAAADKENKLPCVCILQEVNRFDPHQAITAVSFYYEYLEIAAEGECMLLFFALESQDDNDLLHDILEDAEKIYPLDRSRVYITGHSHNGRFSAEYARRHPRDIAALATLGNEPGQLSEKVTSGFFVVSDEQLDIQAAAGVPTVNISGFNERNSMFPLYSDAPHVRSGQWVALNTFEKRTESWQRRLRSANCPAKTVEEITATMNSSDTVERLLGIPADSTEVLFLDGAENYIADIRNKTGKNHLRIIALGNMPHIVTPAMIDLAWSYIRRFARDPGTGACIERY